MNPAVSAAVPPKKWTILEVLEWTKQHFQKKGVATARLDAEVLIAHALGVERITLYTRFDQPLAIEELATIRQLVARRAKFEPVAYILGFREFWSLKVDVTSDVLIPRPYTEILVEMAVNALRGCTAPRIVDVGTGSGCIALALAQELSNATVCALDISRTACGVARRNVDRLGFGERIQVLESDLLLELPASFAPVDAVLANLPYISTAECETLMPDVRDFEPRLALDGGFNGCELIERLVGTASHYLRSGAHLFLEIGSEQIDRVRTFLTDAGLEIECVRPSSDSPAVIGARRKE